MLSGKGNENSEKTTVGLISKKATFHARHTFFSTFLCRGFARLHRETSRNFLVRRFSGALAHEARSGAPWVKKCGKLHIRENLVIT